jgi:hypothetical protein
LKESGNVRQRIRQKKGRSETKVVPRRPCGWKRKADFNDHESWKEIYTPYTSKTEGRETG